MCLCQCRVFDLVRRGLVIHSSGRLETHFQPDAEVQPVFVPVLQGELRDEYHAQSKAAGVDQPFRRDLAVRVEDVLELFVQVFKRPRAPLMQEWLPPYRRWSGTHDDAAVAV